MLRYSSNFFIDGEPGNGLYIDWNFQVYEQQVRDILNTIAGSRSGRVLIDAIRNRVDIIPWQFQRPNNQCNATANVNPPDIRNVSRALARGIRSGRLVGRGTGAASQIQFTPDFFIPSSPLFCFGSGAGTRVDEVFFHEMVHALSISAGVSNTRSLVGSPLAGFGSIYEYYAVVITNVYSS